MANPKSAQASSGHRPVLRVIRGTAFGLMLLFLIWSAGSAGYASLLSTYAARSLRLDAADASVSLNPDAQNHLIRGAVHQARGDLSKAVADYSRAATHRPDDYIIWLNLAHARELSGDRENAIAAASHAVSLAPHYAKPHWQLGNLLLRAGRTEAAYSDLRLASSRNPTLLPAFIDLVWQVSGGDPTSVLTATEPREAQTYKVLAAYFRRRGKPAEAVAMFRAAGVDAGEEVATERRSYLAELLREKQFEHAHDLWMIAHPPDPDGPSMFDPGFENESDLDEPGFGWRAAAPADQTKLSLDSSDPASERFSLQVSFNGSPDPTPAIVSQLVRVRPQTRYRLRFTARTLEVVSGSLPRIVVMEEAAGQVLSESDPFPQTTGAWRDYQLEFSTPANTEAIRISLQRKPCNAPCPIFGRLWLDSFSLQNF